MVAGVPVVFLAGLAVGLQYLLHLFVDEPAVGAGDGLGQVPVLHHGLFVHEEDDAVRQFVLVGAERAEFVAQLFGQHRYGAVHEVDARAALLGLLVDDAPFLYVVRDVGNVHAHFVQAGVNLAYGNGVVEVFGIARVDGEGHHLAHVFAACNLLFRYHVGDALGGVLHLLRIGVGQTELGQYGVHLRFVLARLPQHLRDTPDGVVGVHGPLHDAHRHLVALLGALQVAARDEDVVGQRAVFGDEVGQVVMYFQPAYELLVGPLQDLRHHALAHVALAAGHHGHPHAVAVHGVQGVALGHQYGLSALIGQEGVLAVGLALEGALHLLALVLQGVGVLGLLGQEVLFQHLL